MWFVPCSHCWVWCLVWGVSKGHLACGRTKASWTTAAMLDALDEAVELDSKESTQGEWCNCALSSVFDQALVGCVSSPLCPHSVRLQRVVVCLCFSWARRRRWCRHSRPPKGVEFVCPTPSRVATKQQRQRRR